MEYRWEGKMECMYHTSVSVTSTSAKGGIPVVGKTWGNVKALREAVNV